MIFPVHAAGGHHQGDERLGPLFLMGARENQDERLSALKETGEVLPPDGTLALASDDVFRGAIGVQAARGLPFAGVPEFVAVLGQHAGLDCRLLARWEYHQSHDGWHVHASCGQTANITPGIVKPPGVRRLPEGGAHHRNKELVSAGFVMTDEIAEAIAFDLCGIPYTPDLLTKNALPWT